MSKRNWRYFIADILECIRKIKIYTSSMSYDDLMKDDRRSSETNSREYKRKIWGDSLETNYRIEKSFNTWLLCSRL